MKDSESGKSLILSLEESEDPSGTTGTSRLSNYKTEGIPFKTGLLGQSLLPLPQFSPTKEKKSSLLKQSITLPTHSVIRSPSLILERGVGG